jgi:adenylate cyclase
VVRPEGPNRRLAAILSADVVGYSRLMAEDEAATIQTLTVYRKEIQGLVEEHRGRLVDATGDNLLAELPTALDAVECAVEVQRIIGARNAGLAEDHRMLFRIGIHMGDVTVEEGRLYGDGVNIAARLEGLAQPGGICVSATVHDQVARKLDLDFQDLGDQPIKNIPNPVHAYRSLGQSRNRGVRPLIHIASVGATGLLVLAFLGAVLWNLVSHRLLPSVDDSAADFTVPGFGGMPAIAVLPFDNLSGDPDREYFADGISADVISRLSSGSFPVIARNSTFTYKGSAVNVQQVGRELGARYVVEGSVRRAGDRIRISAQLIDATNDHHVWAETYDRELEDLFAIQDEITQSIASAVGMRLWRAESERVAHQRRPSLDAYDLSMRGTWHLFKGEMAKARSLFEQALELDPSNYEYLYPLALTHYADAVRQENDSPARSLGELDRAARECLAANAQYFGCQLAMGFLASLTGRRDEMLAAFEAAVRLAPGNPYGHYNLGIYTAIAGQPDEGLEHIEKAIRLSPRDPLLGIYFYGVATAHFAAGRYDEAVVWAKRSLTLAPEHASSHLILAVSQAHAGRSDAAATALRDAARLQPGFEASLGGRYSTADPEFVERLIQGVRIAGLPDG